MSEQRTSKERLALRKLVKAWDALPGGRFYNAIVIGDWLQDDMKPAIDAARLVLKEKSK